MKDLGTASVKTPLMERTVHVDGCGHFHRAVLGKPSRNNLTGKTDPPACTCCAEDVNS